MKAFDPADARRNSWISVEKAGLRTNPDLPLLESSLALEPVENIADRLLCMNAVAAHGFGFPSASARAWLEQEQILEALSSRERALLSGAKEHLLAGQMEIHGIYALAWCTSVVKTFSVNDEIPRDLASRLPDLRTLESSKLFRSGLILRPQATILSQLDEAYCFHWAWHDMYLSGNRRLPKNNMLTVAERRKALEWVLRGGDWDQVPLDT